MKRLTWGWIVAAGLLAAGCGGGGDDGETITSQGLSGATVTGTVNMPYTTVISNTVSKTVSDAFTEFPSGTFYSLSSGVFVIGVNIDVQSSRIVVQYTQNASAAVNSFNGYVLQFSADSPVITGATLNAASSFTSSQVGVTYKNHEVAINVSGQLISTGNQIVVDLALASQ